VPYDSLRLPADRSVSGFVQNDATRLSLLDIFNSAKMRAFSDSDVPSTAMICLAAELKT
jgi:hypothetical protein